MGPRLAITNPALWVLRGVFLVTSGGVAVTLIRQGNLPVYPLLLFSLVMLLAGGLIAGDCLLARKRIDLISSVYFGIVVGLFLTYLLSTALAPMFDDTNRGAQGLVQLALAVALCYICVSLLLQTKDDFRFIIPYVEFAKEVKGLKPYVLDTSVVIDGRIADVVETGLLDNQLIMPRFVLTELQSVADSSDKLRRARGRRGLDVLNRLRNNKHVDFKIYDRELPEMAGQSVDMKLVLLAKRLEGKIITGDYNLNKVARVQNVVVLNLNDLANSLKPVFLPGEELDVRIIKAGEGPLQGVGYLDDGTMVVVEGARDKVGQDIHAAVTSVLQTSAGRMIFGRYLATN